ncbi:hypothetical protein [Streptomyces sp. NPDC002588]
MPPDPGRRASSGEPETDATAVSDSDSLGSAPGGYGDRYAEDAFGCADDG